MNERAIKKATDKAAESEMRGEYGFSRGIRGKYTRRYAQGTNVVVLEADVAKVFPNAEAVNDSLRALAGVIQPLDHAIFMDHGYRGLYGGLGMRDIRERKRLKDNLEWG